MKLITILNSGLRVSLLTMLLALGLSTQAGAQTAGKLVSGTVLDKDKNPVAGASVVITGTDRGTTTSRTGDFSLRADSDNPQSVTVSMLGYKTQVAQITGGQVNVTLEPSDNQLDELVVIGYGTTTKKDLTGSVTTIKTKDAVEVQPVSSIDMFLQGRAAGVNINQNSGAPGDGITVQIRGASTLSGNTAPLYVIDGVPIEAETATSSGSTQELNQQPTMNPLASINPNDIASIDILKDASATAIYGSRATNGVIIITTKQGSPGPVRINYNSRVDVSKVSKQYNLLNGYEYGLFENELDRTSLGYDMDGNVVPGGKAPRNSDDQLAFYQQHWTNWQDLMYKTAVSHEQQLSISGGNKVSTFSITGGYLNQNGIIANTGLERYSLRFNYTNQLSKRLQMTFNTSYSQSVQRQTMQSQAANVNQMVKRILTTKPYLMPWDVSTEDSDIPGVTMDNPWIMAYEMKDVLEQQNFMANTAFTYNILKGLDLRVRGSVNSVDGARKTYYPTSTTIGNQNGGEALRGDNKRMNYVFESTLNFNHTFNASNRMDAMAGYTFESRKVDNFQAQTTGFLDDALTYYAIGNGTNAIASSYYEPQKISSLLARANYYLYEKYIFTVTGRYDGSSLLAPGNRWKFFPSAAFAWRVNEEPFLKQVREISNLKLRLSYGLTGNQTIGYAAYNSIMNLARASVNGGSVTLGMVPGSLANPKLGWENTSSYNAGLDIGAFNNRYRLSIDLYDRITKDLLVNFPLPPSAAYSSIPINLGQVSNKGIELEFGADILTKGDFKWSVNANWYLNRNNVDKLGGNKISGQSFIAGGGVLGQSVNISMEGHPVGSFFGYVTNGIYQTKEEAVKAPIDTPAARPGSIRWVDISGPDGLPDGNITSDDMTILGSSQPDFNYGLGTDFSWKGLSLSLFFTGSYGGKVANLNRFILDGFTDTNSNIRREAWEGRWTGPGTSNFYPAVDGSNSSTFFNQRFSNMFVEDGSYFRLKNLSLGYDFSIKRAPWIRSIKVFATATNLFTITKYTGYDPEASASRSALTPGVDFSVYPSSRTFSFGVNLGF